MLSNAQNLFPASAFLEFAIAASLADARLLVLKNVRVQHSRGQELASFGSSHSAALSQVEVSLPEEGLELQEVVFWRPLVVSLKHLVFCEVNSDGSIFFQSESKSVLCEARISAPSRAQWHRNRALVLSKKSEYHHEATDSTNGKWPTPRDQSVLSVRAQCHTESNTVALTYARRMKAGYHGPDFQSIQRVWHNMERRLFVAMVKVGTQSERYYVHPATLDGVIQLSGYVVENESLAQAFVPASIGRVSLYDPIGRTRSKEHASAIYAVAEVVENRARHRVLNFWVGDRSGTSVAMYLEASRFAILERALPSSSVFEETWVTTPKGTSVIEEKERGAVLEAMVLVAPGLESLVRRTRAGLTSRRVKCREIGLNELRDQCDGGVVLLPLTLPDVSATVWLEGLEGYLVFVLETLKTLLHLASEGAPSGWNLVVLTKNSVAGRHSGGLSKDRTGLGSVWGLLRTARLELPRACRVCCVDVDSRRGSGDGFWADIVVDEITVMLESRGSGATEDSDLAQEIMYRQGVRFSRSVRRPSVSQHMVGQVYVDIKKRGRIGSLSVLVSTPLGGDEIVSFDRFHEGREGVMVDAVGLNFKDLLNVLLPDEAAYVGRPVPLPGADFSGRVMVSTDSSVPNPALKGGVFGLLLNDSSGTLRSLAVVGSDSMSRMARGVSFEEASQMPMESLTVEYALGEQGGLGAKEKLLISAAAGGVGLMAIQYGNRVGATIFATASVPKHGFLQLLGVQYVSSSRDAESSRMR